MMTIFTSHRTWAARFIEKLGAFGIYHFTDQENVSSIRTHELLSLEQLDSRGIVVARYGGNALSHELDRKNKVDRFVHLSFTRSHPMLGMCLKDGRIKSGRNIRVDPRVLYRKDVRLCMQVT